TGHGVAGVIWSARRRAGAMAPRAATASVVAAALTIGGGGSVGPEGPIAELGASTASLAGRRMGLPSRWVRMLA
ncbi:Voltage gated Cl-channel, partial [human gut metagenome]